jgi:hypothetical protein
MQHRELSAGPILDRGDHTMAEPGEAGGDHAEHDVLDRGDEGRKVDRGRRRRGLREGENR